MEKKEYISNWIEREKTALEIIQLAGTIYVDSSVELIIFRRSLVDARASEVMNHHEFARNFTNQKLNVNISLDIVKAISKLDLAPSRIDIGVLGKEWLTENQTAESIDNFIAEKLKNLVGKERKVLEPRDIVLFGFGRIGRLAARELIRQTGKGEQLRLRAIVSRTNSDEDILKRASLLRKDSVHGKFRGTVVEDLENKALIINGQKVLMIAANKPEEIDYTQYGIQNAMVIDNSGVWRDREGLGKHLLAKGVTKVLLTAPGKGDIPNIVHGINNENFNPDDEDIFSAASCTTNAIVPVIKVINEAYGIEGGHIETVHSYTNDQNLLDNFHKKYRRGRSAAMNMVITETGAAKAVSKVLPEMDGKMTGNSVRVPTPDVSLAILNLNLNKSVESIESVNQLLREASTFGAFVEQIDYSTSNELVSSDIIGNTHAGVIDAPATLLRLTKQVLYYMYGMIMNMDIQDRL